MRTGALHFHLQDYQDAKRSFEKRTYYSEKTP